MRIVDVIEAKRDGKELQPQEIERIVSGYASGEVPDYQMSAFLMAAYFRGMSFEETAAMTSAMVKSGRTLDLSRVPGTKIDKHSTGGVGDKTTLVLVPILAACGLKVPKISGRGLGFTGGTLDKLESIPGRGGAVPGFNTELSIERFIEQVKQVGAAIAGQTPDLVVADKKIYALRDVTATVDSIPFIAASVMSKKIACASEVILLDVKVGSGAFMQDVEQAKELARTMIAIGRRFGRVVGAALTDMNQPLGSAVGNGLEVAEAIETLKGCGPADLRTLCLELAVMGLNLAGVCSTEEEGKARAKDALESGAALEMFRKIVESQDGDPRVIEDSSILPQAAQKTEVVCRSGGVVSSIDCAAIGRAAMLLGAGRTHKDDQIDPAVGIVVLKKIGDRVTKSEPLAVIHANDSSVVPEVAAAIEAAYTIDYRSEIPPLILERILQPV